MRGLAGLLRFSFCPRSWLSIAPVYQWGNNLLVERVDSYAFYSVDVWMKSLRTFIIVVITFVIIVVLAN